MKYLTLILFLFSIFQINAQNEQSIADTLDVFIESPIPKKATLYSAILPGAGQFYNKKYWKIPILYTGIGITAYFMADNLKNIKRLRSELNAGGDPNLIISLDKYKEWRDWSYVTFALIYALNIVDANVDAHLAHFDVGDDLSLEIHPFTDLTVRRSTGLTLVLKL